MMYVEQLYTGCLAEAAYYIESNGEAAIIDPLREPTPYVEMAKKRNAKIKYVFLTHFHADFVSGHVDLANATGATIVFGPNAHPSFDFHSGKDGELFPIGNINLKLLHTPGHTMESSTYLLLDEEGKEKAIFTGDTLFIGDVGRPDLAVKSDLTEKDLAGHLFDSLRNKIMTLPDEITVYPAHGAGSACGKNMSSETFDTLGNQKIENYALRANMTKEEFVTEVTTGLSSPPQYFPKNVAMNQGINKHYEEILEHGLTALKAKEVEFLMQDQKALILDVRSPQEFAAAHIPNAIFIGLDGGFAPWVGTLIENLKQPIIIVAPKGREEEAVTRLARVGYDHCLGYLEGGLAAWKNAGYAVETIQTISPEAFSEKLQANDAVVDVRRIGEVNAGKLVHNNLIHLCLDDINHNYTQLSKDTPYYVHCAGGYRSIIALSILKQKGFKNLINVEGGFSGIKNCGKLPCVEQSCSSTANSCSS